MSKETDLQRAVNLAGAKYDKAYDAWYKAEYELGAARDAEASARRAQA